MSESQENFDVFDLYIFIIICKDEFAICVVCRYTSIHDTFSNDVWANKPEMQLVFVTIYRRAEAMVQGSKSSLVKPVLVN